MTKAVALPEHVSKAFKEAGGTYSEYYGHVLRGKVKILKFAKLIETQVSDRDEDAPKKCGNCGSEDIRRIDCAWVCHHCDSKLIKGE